MRTFKKIQTAGFYLGRENVVQYIDPLTDGAGDKTLNIFMSCVLVNRA